MNRQNPAGPEFSALTRMLNRVHFLEGLTTAQLNTILPCALLCSCARGEAVFRQGDEGDAFYLIHTGKVAVQAGRGILRTARTVAELGPGDYFGEVALLYPTVRTATVVCLEPTSLFTFTATDFAYIMAECPGLIENIRRTAERRHFLSTHNA
jgi:CRP-like cAMP-binding protein